MTKNRTQERKCKGENESVFVYKFCAKINGAEAPSILQKMERSYAREKGGQPCMVCTNVP